MALASKRITDVIFISFWFIFSNTIHFIINPNSGGIPANLIIVTRVISFLVVFRSFSVILSWFLFQNMNSAVLVTVEYIKKNTRYIFILRMIVVIIHLRLKREERPKISFKCVLFIIRIAPMIAERGIATINM